MKRTWKWYTWYWHNSNNNNYENMISRALFQIQLTLTSYQHMEVLHQSDLWPTKHIPDWCLDVLNMNKDISRYQISWEIFLKFVLLVCNGRWVKKVLKILTNLSSILLFKLRTWVLVYVSKSQIIASFCELDKHNLLLSLNETSFTGSLWPSSWPYLYPVS